MVSGGLMKKAWGGLSRIPQIHQDPWLREPLTGRWVSRLVLLCLVLWRDPFLNYLQRSGWMHWRITGWGTGGCSRTFPYRIWSWIPLASLNRQGGVMLRQSATSHRLRFSFSSSGPEESTFFCLLLKCLFCIQHSRLALWDRSQVLPRPWLWFLTIFRSCPWSSSLSMSVCL